LTTTKKIPVNSADDVSGDTGNLLYMISMLSKEFGFTTKGIGVSTNNDPANPAYNVALYTGTFIQMFANIGFTAAQDEYSKNKSLEAETRVIMAIEDQRNSLSSVSYDEEGVNLLRFQKSYNAAARVMTTLDEALDTLINRMGIVGR
jgi:flagellar hook-associated protein 1 FlgK